MASVDLATVNGISNANEAVSATINTLTTGEQVGLVARYGGSGLANMYYGAIVAGSGDYTAYIYRNVNGASTSLFSQTYTGTATGTTLEFDVVGTSLQLFLNSSIVAYANDSTFTTGSVGMLTSGGAVVVSNFNAVAITPPTASYPFSITATGTSPITGLSNGQLNSYWNIQSGDYVDNAGTLTGQSSGVNLATVNGVSETTENVFLQEKGFRVLPSTWRNKDAALAMLRQGAGQGERTGEYRPPAAPPGWAVMPSAAPSSTTSRLRRRSPRKKPRIKGRRGNRDIVEASPGLHGGVEEAVTTKSGRVRESSRYGGTPRMVAEGRRMRINHVKRALAGGGVSIGTMMFEFATTGIARIAAEAGAGVRHLRHGAYGLEHGDGPDADGDRPHGEDRADRPGADATVPFHLPRAGCRRDGSGGSARRQRRSGSAHRELGDVSARRAARCGLRSRPR